MERTYLRATHRVTVDRTLPPQNGNYYSNQRLGRCLARFNEDDDGGSGACRRTTARHGAHTLLSGKIRTRGVTTPSQSLVGRTAARSWIRHTLVHLALDSFTADSQHRGGVGRGIFQSFAKGQHRNTQKGQRNGSDGHTVKAGRSGFT